MLRSFLITALLALLCLTGFSQLKYYEISFQGGVTAGGWSPTYSGSGTGNFMVFIQPSSTIQRAYFIASRLGNAANVTVTLNGTNYTFSPANQVTGPFQTLYGGPSGVHVIDVTANINPLVTNYSLTVPNQSSTSNRYQDFKLIIYYANNSLPVVHTALFLNTANLNQANHNWNLNLTVPISNANAVGMSFFNSYQCNMTSDAERVYVNGTLLGMTGINDLNSGFCGGTLGNCYYQNSNLFSLGDDNVNQAVNQHDALSNVVALVPNNSTTVNAQFQHNGGGSDNHIWSVLIMYSGCGTPVAGTATAVPTTICSGDSSLITLNGSAGTVQWQQSTNGGGTWTNIPGATDTIYNTSALTTTTCFRAAVTDCGVTVYSNMVCITVNPTPVATATPANQTICSGDITNIALSSNVPGTTFTWTVTQNNVSGASNGSGSTIAQTLTTTVGGTATYTITPTANGCVGLPITVVITVDAPPTTANAGPNQQLCVNNTSLAGNTPTVGTGLWTLISGSGTITNPSSPTSTVTGLGLGNNQFEWTISNGACPPSSAVVTITVNPMPMPSFTTVTACPNQATSFTNTTPGGIISANWSFPGGTPGTGTGNNPTTTYPSGGTYNVTLVITATGGCVDSITQQITVPYTPVADFNFTSVCVGTATVFTNTSSVQNGTITGAQWVFGDGSPVNNTMNPTHTYANCSTYTVTLIVTSNDGCAASVSKQVEVYCLPVASFTAVNACQGNAVNFTNTTQNGVNYLWDFGDNNSSNTVHPSHSYAQPGTYTVTLTVTNGPGCTDVFTSTVTVYPKPIADFNAPNACDGTTINFTNTSSISGGQLVSYAWHFGDNGTSNAQHPTHNYGAPGIYNVTLIVTSDNGCSDTITKSVTIYPKPVVSFTAASVCEGNAVQFAGSSSVPSVASWNWNFGNGSSGSGQNTSHTYNTPGTYQVTLVVTTTNGCVDSVTQTVTVFARPTALFTPDTTSGCAPVCVTFTNLSTISDNSTLTYQWNFGNGFSSSLEEGRQCYQNTGATALTFSVSLTVTSSNGCTHTYTQPNLITVFPMPVADFDADKYTTSIFYPAIQFYDQSYGSVNQYSWNFGDSNGSSEKNPKHTYNDTGSYTVTLTVTNSYGCSSQISKTIKIGPEFAIYVPNAFTPDGDNKNEVFKPVGYGIQEDGYKFLIFDRWGELIYEAYNIREGWNGNVKGGNTPAPVGVYVWKLQFKDVQHKFHQMIGHVTLVK